MGTIVRLDSNTINQIAAGEVIENAASVVKELIENALDAKASHIQIETVSSGQGFIAVRDNGIGMSKEDMHLSLERHATSKIKNFNDLYSLTSLGFRGEALPSIASISKLKLISSTEDQIGYSLVVEGGTLISEGTYSRNKGTCVEVSSLFFNVPVRKKFQKTTRSDFIRIRRLLEDMLLTRVGVGWDWINDGKLELSIEKEATYEDRVKSVFGEDFLYKSLVIDFTKEDISLFGRAGNFEQSRPNRLRQKIFLNNRIIENSLISRKIMECYETILPKDRFPMFILNIQVPPDWSDVNVHPQKKEVRFFQENLILKTIENCFIELFGYVHSEIFEKRSISISDSEKFETIQQLPKFSVEALEDNFSFNEKVYLNDDNQELVVEFHKMNEVESSLKQENLSKEKQLSFFQSSFNLLKNMHPFLLVEEKEELVLIHAVNVRKYLLISSVTDKRKKSLFEKQILLSPLVLDFSFLEASILLQCLDFFHTLHFEIDHFGQNSFAVNAIPSILLEEEIGDFLSEVALELISSTKNDLSFEYFSIILCKFLKKTHVLRKNYPKISLLLNCFWAIGKPNQAPDGTVLCKVINIEDLTKWLDI